MSCIGSSKESLHKWLTLVSISFLIYLVKVNSCLSVSQQESTVCDVPAPDLRGLISRSKYKMNIKHLLIYVWEFFLKAQAHAPDIFHNSNIV